MLGFIEQKDGRYSTNMLSLFTWAGVPCACGVQNQYKRERGEREGGSRAGGDVQQCTTADQVIECAEAIKTSAGHCFRLFGGSEQLKEREKPET